MVASPEDHSARRTREAEQAVLGAMMRDPLQAWPAVEGALDDSHFLGVDHQLIFAAMLELHKEGMPPDSLTVSNQLAHHFQLEAAGGVDYLANLYNETPSAANIRAYVKIVREAADKRKIIDFAQRLSERAANGSAASDLGTDAAAEFERLRENIGIERRPRRFMRWAELAKQSPPERKWRVSHWLGCDEPTLFAGIGGVGKTLIAQALGTALAFGKPFIDQTYEPVKVLVWACEDTHDELWRRQAAVCRYFDIPMTELEGRLTIEPRRGMDNTLLSLNYGAPVWTRTFDELRQQVNDIGANVLFLDNIGQTFGGNENNRHHVTTFCNGLAGLANEFSPVIMGHPAKATDSEFAGSGAWENAVRMRWYMGYKLPDQEPDDNPDKNVRYLAKRKTNYSEQDYRKLIWQEGLFVQEHRNAVLGPPLSPAVRMDSAKACVLAALDRFALSGIRVTDGRTSPDYMPKKMREMNLTHEHSPRELADALSQLRLSGQIIEGSLGKYGNRTSKVGLMRAQT